MDEPARCPGPRICGRPSRSSEAAACRRRRHRRPMSHMTRKRPFSSRTRSPSWTRDGSSRSARRASSTHRPANRFVATFLGECNFVPTARALLPCGPKKVRVGNSGSGLRAMSWRPRVASVDFIGRGFRVPARAPGLRDRRARRPHRRDRCVATSSEATFGFRAGGCPGHRVTLTSTRAPMTLTRFRLRGVPDRADAVPSRRLGGLGFERRGSSPSMTGSAPTARPCSASWRGAQARARGNGRHRQGGSEGMPGKPVIVGVSAPGFAAMRSARGASRWSWAPPP